MSMIINTTTKAYEEQSHRRYPDNWKGEGWLSVPPRLEPRARSYCPYCELEIEDGTLVGIAPTERPEPEPDPPTETQLLGQENTELHLSDIAQGQEITELQLTMMEASANV